MTSACALLIALSAPAYASTFSSETYFSISASFEDGTRAGGQPLKFEFSYDDSGITSASYSIGGYTGAYESTTMGFSFTHQPRVASGFHVHFTIDSNPRETGMINVPGRPPIFYVIDHHPIDNIPLAGVDLNSLTVYLGGVPADTPAPYPHYTEAAIDAYLENVTMMGVSYRYVSSGKTRRYQGGLIGAQNVSLVTGGGRRNTRRSGFQRAASRVWPAVVRNACRPGGCPQPPHLNHNPPP